MEFANKIVLLRKREGWSQEDLAAKLDVSRQAVSKWEAGQGMPDLDRILQLSELFGVSTDYLLKENAKEDEPALRVGIAAPDMLDVMDGTGKSSEAEKTEVIEEKTLRYLAWQKTSALRNSVAAALLTVAVAFPLSGVRSAKLLGMGVGELVMTAFIVGIPLVAVAIWLIVRARKGREEFAGIEQGIGITGQAQVFIEEHVGRFRPRLLFGLIVTVLLVLAGIMFSVLALLSADAIMPVYYHAIGVTCLALGAALGVLCALRRGSIVRLTAR